MADIERKTRQQVGKYMIDVRTNALKGGDTIVLVHGIGVSGRYFLRLAKILAHHYNVVVIDLPGYGATPKPARALSIIELAGVVNEYVKKEKFTRTVLLGQSMGSQIVARAVAVEPSLYEKVIIVGPTTNRRERSVLQQGLRLAQDTFKEPLRVNAIIFSDYLRMGICRYFQTSRYMVTDHIEDALATCSIPLLVIRGDRDPIAPREWTSYLADIAPDGTHAEIKGSPHVVQYVKPQEMADVCTAFIEQ